MSGFVAHLPEIPAKAGIPSKRRKTVRWTDFSEEGHGSGMPHQHRNTPPQPDHYGPLPLILSLSKDAGVFGPLVVILRCGVTAPFEAPKPKRLLSEDTCEGRYPWCITSTGARCLNPTTMDPSLRRGLRDVGSCFEMSNDRPVSGPQGRSRCAVPAAALTA